MICAVDTETYRKNLTTTSVLSVIQISKPTRTCCVVVLTWFHHWQIATIFTRHATNPVLLFVWAPSEREWNNFICSTPSSCWVKDKQSPLCQTIDHKKSDAYMQKHTKTVCGSSAFRWKIQSETDVSVFLHDITCRPTTSGLSVTGKHFQGYSEARVTEQAQGSHKAVESRRKDTKPPFLSV